MRQGNEAVRFSETGYEAAVPNPPPVRTTVFIGQSAPPAAAVTSEPNILLPRTGRDPIARRFIEYVAQLQAEQRAEVLRSQTEAVRTAIDAALEARDLEVAALEKARGSLKRGLQHLLAEEKRIKEMAALQPSTPTLPQVSVPVVAKVASRLVFLVCLFALLLWAITGFAMIHPAIACLVMIGSVGFYMMGRMAERGVS